MKIDPNKRITIDQIIDHPWMQGDIATFDEIQQDFAERKRIVDENAHNEREEKRKNRNNNKHVARRAAGADEEVDGDVDPTEMWT